MKKNNIKTLWSLILVGLIMVVMPIHAITTESKIVRYSKKAAKITWRSGEVITGAILGFFVFVMAKQGFKNDKGETEYVAPLICAGVTASLIANGLSGLNDELEIVKNLKRLYKFAIKEKTNGKKDHEKNSIELSDIS